MEGAASYAELSRTPVIGAYTEATDVLGAYTEHDNP